MKFELRKTLRGMSDDEVLADLRRCAEQLGRTTITQEQYAETGKGHPASVQRRFGSWANALELAGLEPSRSKISITNDELFENLKFVWIQLGRQPARSEVKQPLSRYSSDTYGYRFGTWTKALHSFVEWVNSDSPVEISAPQMEEPSTSPTMQKHRTKRGITDRQRFRVLMRDGFACTSCGASPSQIRGVELHVDHLVPWSKGGESFDENLTTKCAKCNLGKGNAFNS